VRSDNPARPANWAISDPGDQLRELRIVRRLRAQYVAELRLVTWSPCVKDQELRNPVGNRAAEILLDHGQRHVDACRDPGGGPDIDQ
jgi:hypothetical protein